MRCTFGLTRCHHCLFCPVIADAYFNAYLNQVGVMSVMGEPFFAMQSVKIHIPVMLCVSSKFLEAHSGRD